MAAFGPVTHTPLTIIQVDGRAVRVTLHTAHDGIELVGRLFFADAEWQHSEIPDRGVFPGRTLHDVEARARDLRVEELVQRYRRANAEKRRFLGLRQVTNELIAKVRYLNQVAISVRTGLLDAEAAGQEMDLTEAQMVELVRQAQRVAGVEG